jgi:hypothetical protein
VLGPKSQPVVTSVEVKGGASTSLGSTLDFGELGESRQLAAEYLMCEVVKHFEVRHVVTAKVTSTKNKGRS